eukprot:CAMPEP_0198604066 /NCGR_PEP_ID=MMETSP1462-20131121/152727_1 /TAXON_ID=1333877 /ORGANISM="Brandtodinium nutriculum, Strain RCC3387" /LENGTH=68 /DNA_ID=CAMNT_0044335847 /DNA_START=106 /DNA_END=309 /DNA_ORIENTATION=+
MPPQGSIDRERAARRVGVHCDGRLARKCVADSLCNCLIEPDGDETTVPPRPNAFRHWPIRMDHTPVTA